MMQSNKVYVWTYVHSGVFNKPIMLLGYESALDFIRKSNLEFVERLDASSIYKSNNCYYVWFVITGDNFLVRVPENLINEFKNFVRNKSHEPTIKRSSAAWACELDN